jgi:SET domain-containing protein
MLTVNTRIAPSTIHGIGLFAAQEIEAGTIVWKHSLSLDPVWLKVDVDELFGNEKVTMLNYCYVNSRGEYVLCGDDARFWNFSETPNCDVVMARKGENPVVAVKKIKRGEEMTISFRSDNDFKRKLGLK